jgi:hypothetical protein
MMEHMQRMMGNGQNSTGNMMDGRLCSKLFLFLFSVYWSLTTLCSYKHLSLSNIPIDNDILGNYPNVGNPILLFEPISQVEPHETNMVGENVFAKSPNDASTEILMYHKEKIFSKEDK